MDINKILDNLNMSSPEVSDFHDCLNYYRYDDCLEILKNYLNLQEAQFVLDYFKAKNSISYDLIEITKNDVIEDESYLFKVGSTIAMAKVFSLSGNVQFILNNQYHEVKNAHQIWRLKTRV